MRITQKDIANRLGVSRSLVAGVLNSDPSVGVSIAKRERILEASRKLGYRPNAMACALATGVTKVVAVWVAFPYSAFYAKLLKELRDVARRDGHQLMISESEPGIDYTGSASAPWDWPADGILSIDSKARLKSHYLRDSAATPLVEISIGQKGSRNHVDCDMFGASKDAVLQLVASGRRRICFLAPRFLFAEAHESRQYGYMQAMQSVGLAPEKLFVDSWLDRDEASACVFERFQSANAPDALFCFSDDMAIGAYQALRRLGLRVPHDVSVFGCGNIDDGRFHEPPLSTLDLRGAEACQLAWTMLKRRMASPGAPEESQVLEARLIRRGSA